MLKLSNKDVFKAEVEKLDGTFEVLEARPLSLKDVREMNKRATKNIKKDPFDGTVEQLDTTFGKHNWDEYDYKLLIQLITAYTENIQNMTKKK